MFHFYYSKHTTFILKTPYIFGEYIECFGQKHSMFLHDYMRT